jgi:hypothetical protein
MTYAAEVLNSAFTCPFADMNAVHTYRIDGGSTCGLLVSILIFNRRTTRLR